MRYKHKNSNIVHFTGLTVLMAAAVVTALHLPEPVSEDKHGIKHEAGHGHERREREEIGHDHVGYNNYQRTPARSANF